MKKIIFSGAATAIVTPMNEDGSICYDSLENLLEYQIENQIDGIVVAGTTGEASTLSFEEYHDLVQFVVKTVSHRVPVIAGAGSNHTAHAIELSRCAETCGADALLHVTPYYNKTSQDGLIAHFSACANAVSIPIFLYNVPSRTSVNLLPQTVSVLAKHPNICAVKEASGSIHQVCQIAALCQDTISIYSGNDDQVLPILSLGGEGVISVISNVLPMQMHQLCELAQNGEWETARQIQLDLLPLMDALFCDINPMPIKAVMNELGFRVGPCRLPLTAVTADKHERLSAAAKLLRTWMS